MRTKTYLISWALVILLASQSELFALAFDKQKLLALKPLCSERINNQALDYKNNRLQALGTFALVGIGLFSINYGGPIDNSRLGALSVGWVSLLSGTLIFLSTGTPVIQNNTFQRLGLTGLDKEAAAYAILKNNAAQSKDARKRSGVLLAASGLGAAVLTALADGATQSYKDTMNLGAAVNLVLGLYALFNPGANEKEMDEIDSVVGTP